MAPNDSILPREADRFTDREDALFDELAAQAEAEAIVEALFPYR